VELSFLSPLGLLLVLAAAVPLAAFAFAELRGRRAAAALGLAGRRSLSRVVAAAALLLVALLLALAAAQPVVALTATESTRADAEAFFVFDTSRSMLASRGPSGLTRFQRARIAAVRLRARLPELRAGIASVTDRTLPHLFPTIDQAVFRQTADRVVGVEKPPPSGYNTVATTLDALTALANRSFFDRSARRRLVFVLSDAESRPFVQASVGAVFRRPPGVKLIFIRFWHADERVYVHGRLEPQYRPDPASAGIAKRLAAATGGSAFDEGELGAAASAARRYLGSGPRVGATHQRRRLSLAPWLALAAVLPVGFLLARRNA
jgi:hypothetical protein